MAKETIMSRITDQEFEEIVKTSKSLNEIGIRCGYSNHSGASSAIIKKRILDQGLEFSTLRGGENGTIRTDEEIFVTDSPVCQSTLRRRYIAGRFSEYKCAICGQIPIWQGKELVLTLDHINGHNKDNRLENLRWVCPNCDRQLDTFAGRNIQYEDNQNYCIDCGAPIIRSSTRCPACAAKENGLRERKVVRPDRDTLKSLIRTQSFVQIGQRYGVSDNAVRKWCDAENLPRKKKEIAKFTDEAWLMV